MADEHAISSYTVIDLFAGCGGMTQGFVGRASIRPCSRVGPGRRRDLRGQLRRGPHLLGRHRGSAGQPVSRGGRRDRRASVPGFLEPRHQGPRRSRNKFWREYMRVVTKADRRSSSSRTWTGFGLTRVPAAHGAKSRTGALEDYAIATILNAADYGVPNADAGPSSSAPASVSRNFRADASPVPGR